ncbi:MAG: hypothetical protein WEB85_03240 [Dongiaceae bacterium]
MAEPVADGRLEKPLASRSATRFAAIVIRTVGVARATAKIALADLTDNFARLA